MSSHAAMSKGGAGSAPDLIAIRALLERSGLPTRHLESARSEFVVIGEKGEVIAAGALQRCGSSVSAQAWPWAAR